MVTKKEVEEIKKDITEVKELLIQLIELIKLETTLDKYKIGCKMDCEKDCSSID